MIARDGRESLQYGPRQFVISRVRFVGCLTEPANIAIYAGAMVRYANRRRSLPQGPITAPEA
jgi:hypothetical protein